MVSPTKLTRMDVKVKAFVAKEFATAPNYQAHVVQLWDRYRDLGLPNDDFLAELTSGKKPSLFQRVWEMMVARHLDAQGHKLTCLGRGPDFRFEHDGAGKPPRPTPHPVSSASSQCFGGSHGGAAMLARDGRKTRHAP
jgi:hypothetical protein